MTDSLFTHFDALDALLCSEATEERPIGWLWFRLVTDEQYRQECFAKLGIA